MINIAAVVDSLGPSQKSFYLIKEFNRASLKQDVCVSVFHKRASISVIPTMFSCKNISSLSGFHHTAISTTIVDASILLSSSNACSKYLYLWDFDWLGSTMKFKDVCKVLLDERLNIIARSDEHAQMIENYCNKKPVAIIDNWKLEDLISLTQEGYVNV